MEDEMQRIRRTGTAEVDIEELAVTSAASDGAPGKRVERRVEGLESGEGSQLGPLHDLTGRLLGQECGQRRDLGKLRHGAPLSSRGPEPAEPTLRARELVDLDERGLLDALDHQLRDAVTALDLVGLVRVGVRQDDPHLVAVSRVDQARAVDTGDAVA